MRNTLSSNPPQRSTASIASGGARRHFVANVASNMAYMSLTSVAMTLYIPFLIRHLGVAAYGMIPLANAAIMYMATIIDGLNVAANRYLAIDLNRGDVGAANRTFNTSLAISLVATGLMLPLAAGVTWFFPQLFQVPSGLELQSRILFASVALTFFLTMLDSNVAVSTMIVHRFDLRNLVRGLTMITRMGLVLLLFMLLPAQLWYVGLGFVLSALVSLVGNWQLWRLLTPQLRISLAAVDRSRMREMMGFSGWVVINRIGMLLFLGTDLVIVNVYFGPVMTGSYGTLLLFPDLMRNIVDTVSSVLSPAIMSRYALHDFDGLRALAARSLKLFGIGLALPIGLLCGLSRPFLQIWLGPTFGDLALLLVVLVGHMSINLATLPLSYVLTAYNKVRIQGVATLLLGVVNVVLAVALARWGSWGAVGVAAATAIVLTVRNLIFLSSYCARVMGLPGWTFYVPLIAGALGTVAVGCVGWLLTLFWWPQGWLELAALAAGVTVIYAVWVYALGLSRADRAFVWELLPPSLRRTFHLSK